MKIYFSEPVADGPAWVDDLAEMPAPAAPAEPAARRGLRNWQKFVAVYGMMTAGFALLMRNLVLSTGGNEAGARLIVVLVVVAALAASIVTLTLAQRRGRL